MSKLDVAEGIDGASVAAKILGGDTGRFRTVWTTEQWSEEACQFVRDKLGFDPDMGVGSDLLRKHAGGPERVLVVEGNLLLNEGIQRLLDLGIAAGGTAFNNANAFIGVGDTNTAAAATQTEL